MTKARDLANSVNSESIPAARLQSNSIGASKLAPDSVDSSEVANDAISTNKVQNAAITNAKLAFDGGALSGFRNAVMNGNFDVWQRGTTNGSAVGGFLADRFRASVAGSSITQSQQAYDLGQTAVPNEPTFFWRGAVTSVAGAGNLAALVQPVENVRTFAGQTATLSFWAKADASKNMAVEFSQNFGSGGSPSGSVNGLGVTTCALTTSWQKFTATVTFPSLSGKTLGTAGDHYISLIFWFDAGSNFNSRTNSLGQQGGTFDIAQVQLEPGSVATPFERRSYGQELALCQRYYYQTVINEGIGVCYSATQASFKAKLPVTMRATPTLTMPSSGAFRGDLANGNKTSATAPVATNATVSDVYWYNAGYTSATAGELVYWNGSSILISAEL